MKLILSSIIAATLLSACATQSPEQKIEQQTERVQVAAQVSRGMSSTVPAAITECIKQIETGSYSEASLISAGFNKGNAVFNSAYVANVSGPVTQGLASAPLRLGVNIGPSGASLGVSGCKITLPSQGQSVSSFVSMSSNVFQANGYTFSRTGSGRFVIEKPNVNIYMTIERIRTGAGTVTNATIRQVRS